MEQVTSPFWTHNLNPVFISVLGQDVTYYWLSYFAIYFTTITFCYILCRQHLIPYKTDIALGFFWYLWGCAVIGARVGQIVFFNPHYYWNNPQKLLALSEGGMAFHGGFLTTVITVWAYAKVRRIDFMPLFDMMATCVPAGIFIGRIANFINGECVGRISTVPWAVIFPYYGTDPRHPSQLYEAFLTGEVLFVFMWMGRRRLKVRGLQWAFFLMGYGSFRFASEFFREPYQTQLFSLGPLTVSQVLCLAMFSLGLILFTRLRKTNNERTHQ